MGVGLEVGPGVELERQPGRRQLLEHHRPVAGVAGVGAGPDGGGGGERLEVGVPLEQAGDDRHRVVAAARRRARARPRSASAGPTTGCGRSAPRSGARASAAGATTRRRGGCRRSTGRRRARRRTGGPARSAPPARRIASSVVRQMPVVSSTVLRSSSLWIRGWAPCREDTRSKSSEAALTRSRERLSTSANSHSTPSVGSGESAKSMATGSSFHARRVLGVASSGCGVGTAEAAADIARAKDPSALRKPSFPIT